VRRDLDPPRFEVATLDGDQVLQLRWFGGVTSVGWDGSAQDARELVTGLADTAAASISGDFWIQGDGWRARTTYGDQV
jgi:hypothetical protein